MRIPPTRCRILLETHQKARSVLFRGGAKSGLLHHPAGRCFFGFNVAKESIFAQVGARVIKRCAEEFTGKTLAPNLWNEMEKYLQPLFGEPDPEAANAHVMTRMGQGPGRDGVARPVLHVPVQIALASGFKQPEVQRQRLLGWRAARQARRAKRGVVHIHAQPCQRTGPGASLGLISAAKTFRQLVLWPRAGYAAP